MPLLSARPRQLAAQRQLALLLRVLLGPAALIGNEATDAVPQVADLLDGDRYVADWGSLDVCNWDLAVERED